MRLADGPTHRANRFACSLPRDGHASYRAMTQYVPHAAHRWCHGVTQLPCVARHWCFIHVSHAKADDARRAARGLMRCDRTAFDARLVTAPALCAAAASAWNMRWPTCAAKPDNDREWR